MVTPDKPEVKHRLYTTHRNLLSEVRRSNDNYRDPSVRGKFSTSRFNLGLGTDEHDFSLFQV